MVDGCFEYFFYFHPPVLGKIMKFELIFFRWVETANQILPWKSNRYF